MATVLTFITALANPATTPSTVVTCMYVTFFSIMICCFEMQLKAVMLYISGNFGFFNNPKLRSVFIFFVAFLCFPLGLLGIISGSALCALAILNMYALCYFPDYVLSPAISDEQKAEAIRKAGGLAASAYMSSSVPGFGHQQAASSQGAPSQPTFTAV